MASLSISEMGLVLTVIRIRGVLQNRKKLVVFALLCSGRISGCLLLPAACSLRGVRRMVPGPYRGKCCFFGVGAGNDFIYSSVAAVTGSSVEADPFIHHLGPSLPDLFPYSRATLLSISFFLALLNKWISLAVRSFRINIYYGLLPWFRSLIQRKSLVLSM